MTVSASPHAWRVYCSLMSGRGQEPSAAFGRFRGRYRLANSFTNATFSDLGPGAQAGYTSLLRLALAYGALESLCSALGRPVGKESVVSAAISAKLRVKRSARIVEVMRSDARPGLARQIAHLIDTAVVVDVMPAAAFYRHSFLHGDLTATRAGTGRSTWERGIVDDLAGALLVTADDRFSEYVTALP